MAQPVPRLRRKVNFNSPSANLCHLFPSSPAIWSANTTLRTHNVKDPCSIPQRLVAADQRRVRLLCGFTLTCKAEIRRTRAVETEGQPSHICPTA